MKNNKLVRAVSAGLATVIIGTTFFTYFRVPANGSFSLNYIEKIKKKNSFSIVEIAPTADVGTMGYLVEGQEPALVRNWVSTIASMDSKSKRKNYADNLFEILKNKDLASTEADAAPLYLADDYEEHNPWDQDFYVKDGSKFKINPSYESAQNNKVYMNAYEVFNTTGEAVQKNTSDEDTGFDFDMIPDYKLADPVPVNYFDFEQWYKKSSETYNSDTEFHEMTHSVDTFTPTIETYKDDHTIRINMNGDDENQESFIKMTNSADNYMVSLGGGLEYTISYKTEITPVPKNPEAENPEFYNLESVVKVLKYTDSGFSEEVTYRDNTNGFQTHNVTFSSSTPIALSFGAKGRGGVEISDIWVSVSQQANYVQNLTQIGYGQVPDSYSDNLFKPVDFYNSVKSNSLYNQTVGEGTDTEGNPIAVRDSVSLNLEGMELIVKSDGLEGTQDSAHPHKVYTNSFGSSYFFFMNAEKGATYEVTYDVSLKGAGTAMVDLYPYNASFETAKLKMQNTSNSVEKAEYISSTDGTNTFSFTIDDDTPENKDDNAGFLQISFGVDGANTTASFTEVSVRKKSKPVAYYYDLEATAEFYYRSGSDKVLPPDNTEVYTKDDNGHFKYAGVYHQSSTEFELHTGTTYYTIARKPGTAPSESFNETKNPYYCVYDPQNFRQVFYTDENTGETKYSDRGFFTQSSYSLEFVGLGKGSYRINHSVSQPLKVRSALFFYTGGIKNNNWFKTKVLDIEPSDAQGTNSKPMIKVTVMDPTDSNLADMVSSADLVVISGGLDLFADTVNYKVDVADSNVFENIKSRVNLKNAVVVDTALLNLNESSYPNMREIIDYLTTNNGIDEGGVFGSVYAYHAQDCGFTGGAPLVNKHFWNFHIENMVYSVDYAGNPDSKYNPVYVEIYRENRNFREKQTPSLDPMTYSDVTEATCIRYTLSYKEQRVFQTLASVKILDIEPCSANATLVVAPAGSSVPKGKTNINDLVPSDYQFDEDKVAITCMSVSEFVAKNEDFSEIYDMIYIGNSTDNMARTLKKGDQFKYAYYDENGIEHTGKGTLDNKGDLDPEYTKLVNQQLVPKLQEGDPIYNDPHMNGYYYTNVGDIIDTAEKTALDYNVFTHDAWWWVNPLHWGTGINAIKDLANPPSLGGMLKEDYMQGSEVGGLLADTTYIPLGGHASMRASGNDLNEATMERLQAFVDNGKPVLLADSFVKSGINNDYKIKLESTKLKKLNGLDTSDFTCTILDEEGNDLAYEDVDITYEWHHRYNDGIVDENQTDLNLKYPSQIDLNWVGRQNTAQFNTSGIKVIGKRQVEIRPKWTIFNIGVKKVWVDVYGSNVTLKGYKMPETNDEVPAVGTYWVTVTITRGSFTYTEDSNPIEIKMDEANADRFVAHFCAQPHYKRIGLWGLYGFGGYDDLVNYWVEFYKQDANGNSTSTQFDTSEYSPRYTWYNEGDGTCVEPQILTKQWLDANKTKWSSQSARINDCNWNRVICMIEWKIQGEYTPLVSSKPYPEPNVWNDYVKNKLGVKNEYPYYSSNPTTVYISNAIDSDAADHSDCKLYPYGDLFKIEKIRNHDNAIDDISSKNNYPEFPYQITKLEDKNHVTDLQPFHVGSQPDLKANNLDNCSYMWQFISSRFYDKRNVTMFCVKDAKNSVVQPKEKQSGTSFVKTAFTSMPQPEIEFITNPKSYNPEDPAGSTLDNRTLTFKYKIIDESTGHDSIKYIPEFYVDSDADGKFEYLESFSAVGVGVEKEFSRAFSKQFVGLVPWKIVFRQEYNAEDGDAYFKAAHISHTGYAYVKPEDDDAQVINAVMVLPGAWNPAEWDQPYYKISDLVKNETDLSIAGHIKKIKENYWSENEYIGCVFDSPVFDELCAEEIDGVAGKKLRRMKQTDFGDTVSFKSFDKEGNKGGVGTDGYYHLGFIVDDGDIKLMITCINVHQLNNIYGLSQNTSEGQYNKKTWTCPKCGESIKQMLYCTKCGTGMPNDFLAAYNMLILGFGDSWGKLTATVFDFVNEKQIGEGLSLNSAVSIRNYIRSGKAVLFCHDTTNKHVDFLDLTIDKIKSFFLEIESGIANIANAIISFFTGHDQIDTLDIGYKNTKIKEGYWDNIILREYLGLDRYGITYSISQRAEAIVNGEPGAESGFSQVLKNPYDNIPLGRAHMYNYIYNGYAEKGDTTWLDDDSNERKPVNFTARDLTVDTMIKSDHSIAWVPGSALTYKKAGVDGAYEASNVYYIRKTIDEETMKISEEVLKADKAMVAQGQPKLDKNGNIHGEFDRYTQGFTNYTIARYADPNNERQFFPSKALDRGTTVNNASLTVDTEDVEGRYSATYDRSWLRNNNQKYFASEAITQVNEGKITTYPYDINFGAKLDLHTEAGMNATAQIKKTHEQVYQCNMNGDDITVWYCLSGGDYWTKNPLTGEYTGIRNDAANAYYIYSRKNVTYTGAGHTNSFEEVEAKLFINTLVAAYRENASRPSAQFRDDINSRQERYLLMCKETNTKTTPPTVTYDPDEVYFSVYDMNIATGKILQAAFYYTKTNEDGSISKLPITVDNLSVQANNGTWIPSQNANALAPNKLYRFTVPAQIKALFEGENPEKSVDLYLVPTVRIPAGENKYTNYEGDEISIQISLLELSDLG